MKQDFKLIGFTDSKEVVNLEYLVQDARELDVQRHGKKYWCVLEDSRFADLFGLRLLEPYRWSDGSQVMFGWTDGQNVFDDVNTPIHADDLCVIMFKKER